MKQGLMEFIDATPNIFICVDNIKTELMNKNYIELAEQVPWQVERGKNYFITKNDSALIAFQVGKRLENPGFHIVAAHGDSPSFQLKPNYEFLENGYLKVNTDKYGGRINYSWLDRPLSIAGRVITKQKNQLRKHMLNIEQDLMIIPSQAIHSNPQVNEKNALNPQVDMLPIVSLTNEPGGLDLLVKQAVGTTDSLVDYDLFLYNRDKAKLVGLNQEFLLAPRLDDLSCVYLGLQSFINSTNPYDINVFCVFNQEEIGNINQSGADSTFLEETLTQIMNDLNLEKTRTLANSFQISADNSHAVHPNAPAKSDPLHKVKMGQGIVIKHHMNYTTDSVSAAILRQICDQAELPYQDYANRSDAPTGSTLGKSSIRHVSIDSVDIGLAQLAMHSANEMIGTDDITYLYQTLQEFYETRILKQQNMITIEPVKR